jgi:hypothetical protein
MHLDDSDVAPELVAALDGLMRSAACAAVRIDLFPPQASVIPVLRGLGFHDSSTWSVTKRSVVLCLDEPIESLRARMKKKDRYAIRAAERAGIVICSYPAASIADFFLMHSMSARAKGFTTFPMAYFEYLLQLFGSSGRLQLFVAYWNGRPVAAIANPLLGSYMIYGWGGMDRDESIRRLMPNYLLHMEAARWAQVNGCEHYDLSGVTMFKRTWPPPMRKYYGLRGIMQSRIAQVAWSRPILRRTVDKIAWYTGCRPRMPY